MIKDFKDKIDFYLKNPEERQKIASQGQAHVLENYNIGKITGGFLKSIKERM